MENSKGFHLNTTQPSLQVQREDGEKPYPYTHASLLPQSLQTSPYYGESCGMRNFSSIVCQSPFPPEVPSCDPTGVSAHYVQTLQTAEYDENKELQFKMAKANRKQKLANKKINPSTSSASQCGYSKKSSKKIYSGYNNGSDQDGRVVYTRDNVREVEENLPGLATKEGVDIVMRDVFSDTQWRMKYRFWANQKGNIYLFDQCANFVKKNSLEAGDHLELYHDEQKNLTKEKGAAQASNLQENVRESYLSMMLEASGEEELSWRVLMKELKDKEQGNGNLL